MNLMQQVKDFIFKPKPVRQITLWPAWAQSTPQWIMEHTNFVEEGFNLNAVLYSAIMYKARAAQTATPFAYRGERDAPERLPPDHPLSRFCDRPNPWMSFPEMAMLTDVYYNLFGNCYAVFIKTPDEILGYPLRPDYVHHIYDPRKRDRLLGFVYAPAGTPLQDGTPMLAQDVMHVKLPNPGDPYAGLGKGLSPLYPMARSVDVDNAATAFLKLFFDNGAMPQGVITTEQQLDDDTAGMLRERWTKTYGNFKNWHEPLVFGSGAQYKRIGLTFDELDLSSLDARNESRTVMPFGVPLNLIESRPALVQSTYSNKETDRRMFWEDTMGSELRAFEVEYMFYLRQDDGATIAFDYENIPALIDAKLERAEAYGKGFDRGAVTQDQYLAALGLPPLPDGRGAVLKLPLMVQLVPIYGNAAVQTEGGAAASTDEEPAKAITENKAAKGLTLEQKQLHYKAFDMRAEAFEPLANAAAARAFELDRRMLLALVGAAQAKAYTAKANVAWQPVLMSALDYVRTAGKDQWMQEFIPVFEAIIVEQGEALNAEFGMEFDVRNLLGEEWFQQYVLKFADEITATTEDAIKALFEKALAEGWSVPDMEKQLQVLFDVWITGDSPDKVDFALDRMPLWRRELIARDQSLRASNAGAQELYVSWGAPLKEWLSTPGNRTRADHRIGIAWGQPPVVVPVTMPFQVGPDMLMYPGDPSGTLSNVIQCRCQSIPVIDVED